MANDYFDLDNPLDRHTLGRAENVNEIFRAVEAGFDKLPSPEDISEGRVAYAADTGAANAYLVDLSQAPSGYTAGMVITMKADNANTAASTINVNSLGVKTIKRYDGADLVAGDIEAGQLVSLGYDGANFRLIGVHGGDVASAKAYAEAAEEHADSAEEDKNETKALMKSFRGVYYGALSADPALDPNGDAPGAGDWYYNTTANVARIYNGLGWEDLGTQARLKIFVFTAEGGETSVSGEDDNGNTMAYNADALQVFKNGARLVPGEGYTASNGSAITGLAALSPGDVIQADAFTPFEVGEQPLYAENNLNDVDDAAAARANLGLGAAAVLGTASVANIRAGSGTGLVSSAGVTSALAEVELADAATIAVAGGSFINGKVTIAGDRTLGNMTGKVVGRTYYLRVLSNSATERTLTLGPEYAALAGTDLEDITNAAGGRLVLSLYVVASDLVIVSGGKY